MKDSFLTNKTSLKFEDRIKSCLKKCNSFRWSVSFIKKAGLNIIEHEMEEALERGAKGKIITSTYQNFTDLASLNTFVEWMNKYDNFECHLDFNCFGEDGFHSKGYLFEYDDSIEFIVGSTNITRFAIMKNVEWNVSLTAKEKFGSYLEACDAFDELWSKTLKLDDDLINKYRTQMDYSLEKWDMDYVNPNSFVVRPNAMQRKALKEIRRYRDMGVQRALIISATGSGKTYLAALDARNFEAKRLLYVVHRDVILREARNTFINVFGSSRTYGLYTGKDQNLDCDFIFASSNMLAKHIDEFSKTEFDYIVYDEVHHIAADCGQKIFKYFSPGFLLGLTATPERMDNQDIFGLFDQNVPFELRLRDAILYDLVVPFHYFGIRDELTDYKDKDRMKVAKEIAKESNISFIAEQIEKHRKANEKLKCLAFCTSIQHCQLMSERFVEIGYNAQALTGKNDLGERIKAFRDLQDENNPLEIICTVDILNEGVDIPAVNMVLFLRPTESQTIFIQQLGRGLRKYQGKEYVTVLDFIGNNYDRSIQIALALGTLGKTVYTEKTYLKDLVSTDFKNLGIPGVEINIDDLSKEEIINYIDGTKFNTLNFLKADYENFKKYLKVETYPSHCDYLEQDIAPDLDRFIKSNMKSSKNKSYYSFLKKIGEETIPLFNDDEIKLIDSLEELLPLVRPEEYLIVKQMVNEGRIDLSLLHDYSSRITEDSLKFAYKNLIKKEIINNQKVNLSECKNEFKDYLNDTLDYGLKRCEIEFGEFIGQYKLYRNYSKEQVAMVLLKENVMDLMLKGTYYLENGDTYCFVGLKKDEEGRLMYKDKFINSSTFQWESVNNTTLENNEGRRLANTSRVHLFVRKVDKVDGIVVPFTYFGTGKFENVRETYTEEIKDGKTVRYPTLTYDIKLDVTVPKEYRVDFEIPEGDGHVEDN